MASYPQCITDISIHALLAESDSFCAEFIILQMIFLSTLSLRRATSGKCAVSSAISFLSTLSLRRATLAALAIKPITKISIHALLAESDNSADVNGVQG